jgi:hypothetical protein
MNTLNLLKQGTLLLLVSVFILTSCEKDEESKEDQLIGKWNITSVETVITINGKDIIDYFMEDLGLSQSEAEEFAEWFTFDITGTIEIKSDGTYETVFDGETDSGTWELVDNTLTLDKGTNDEVEVEIISITSSKLVFEMVESDNSEDFDEDGTNDNLVMKMKYNCSK